MAKVRTCFLCGNKYSYCPTCDRDKLKPSWYSIFCGENCKAVNDIVSANTAKKMSNKEANEALKKINVSEMNIQDADVKAKVNELLNYKDKEQKEFSFKKSPVEEK
ncbi:MAG: hypothetical protein J6W64_04215 [Bacilli bacterium]|nr:hypothetical protein [Bacilli bacterium]MBO7518643.1 hypothetical protein [Methanobrevibacter sp.]